VANNIDFIVKNGLQVSSNLIVGQSYIGTTNPALNGAIIQGNVGIGTTNPTSNLHVVGTSNLVGNLRITNSAVQSGILFPDGTFQGTAAFYTPPGAPTNSIQYNNSGTFAGSSNLIWDPTNSRLGINKSVPSYALDVAGTISSNYLITGNIFTSNTATLQNLVANAAIQSLGSVTSNTLVGNLSITSLSTINSQGQATFNNVVSNTTIVGASLTSTGPINSAGTASFGAIISNSSLQTNTLQANAGIVATGPIQSTAAITANNFVANTNIITPGTITANGVAQFQSIISNSSIVGTNITSTGTILAAGQISANSLYSNTTIQSPNSITGNTIVGNLSITSLGTINSLGIATFQSIVSNTVIQATNFYAIGTINSGGATTVGSLVSNSLIQTNILQANALIQTPATVIANALIANNTITSLGTLNIAGTAVVNNLTSNSSVQATNINALINITAGQVGQFGSVISNSTVSATGISSTGTIAGNTIIGNLNISTPGALSVGSLTSVNNLVANTAIQSLGSLTSNTVISNLSIATPGTLVVGGQATVNSVVANTAIQSLGSITANTIVSNLSITGLGSLNISGAATVNSLVANTTILASGNITTLTNIIANNAITNSITNTGNITVNGLLKSGALQTAATIISGATTLTNLNFGQLIEVTGGPYTVTLTNPVLSSGAWFEFYLNNSSAVSITLSTPAGIFAGPSGNSGSSMVINSGLSSFITVMSDGTNWIVSNSVNVNSAGNVAIGNVAATSPLTVAGNVKIANTAIQAGIIFPDNTYQSTAATLPVRQTILVASNATNQTYNISGGYIPSQLDVYVNGVRLNYLDYTAINGANIQIAGSYTVGSIIDVVGNKTYSGYTGYTPPTTTGFGNMVLATSPTVFTPTVVGNIQISNLTAQSGIIFSDGSVQFSAANTAPVRQSFLADGSNVTYTISNGYIPNQLDVFVNGVKLDYTAYTALNGANITLSSVYPNGSTIDVLGSRIYGGYTGYVPPPTTGSGNMVLATSPTVFTPTSVGNIRISNLVNQSGIVFSDGSVQYSAANVSQIRQTFVADGSTSTFTVTGGYIPSQLDVYVNGIKLSYTDVNVSNGAVFSTNITYPAGAVIDVVGNKTYLGAYTGYTPPPSTGSGNMVLNNSPILTSATLNSPILITPNIGTPTFGNLINATGMLLSNTSGVLPVTRGGTGNTTAFTSGSVVFAGASGTYTQNNSQLFWDNTNNRLGIGTTSPSYLLDVVGTTNGFAGTRIYNNNSGSSTLTYLQLGNDLNGAAATIGLSSSTNGSWPGGPGALFIANGLAYPIAFSTSGGERMRIDAGGNVGIGTTSPNSFGKFAVSGVLGTVYVGLNGDAFAFSKGGTNYISTSSSGGALQFQTGASSNALLLDSSQNATFSAKVAISTNNNFALDITGSNNGYYGMRIYNNNGGASAVTYLQLGNDSNAYTGYLGLNGGTNTGAVGGANAVVLSNGLTAPISFVTSGAERIRINGTGGMVIYGYSSGTPFITVNNSGTTGAQVATFTATNKPGTGTTAPSKWLPIIMDGTTYYIPAWQ